MSKDQEFIKLIEWCIARLTYGEKRHAQQELEKIIKGEG